MKSTAQLLCLLSTTAVCVHARPQNQGSGTGALENRPGPYSLQAAPVWGISPAQGASQPQSTPIPQGASQPQNIPSPQGGPQPSSIREAQPISTPEAQPISTPEPQISAQSPGSGSNSLESTPGPYTLEPAPVWNGSLPPLSGPEAAAAKKVKDWQGQYNDYILKKLEGRTTGCTKDKLQERQEWHSMSKDERIEYTTAVQCLQKLPNKVSNEEIPGARSRFDDVISTHILQTFHIHFSGQFLHWHRYYMYIYDKMLRSECDYKGPTPYWDWTLTYQDPLKSKIFDGSVDSMGSNGESIPHEGTLTFAFPGRNFTVPPGTGGGCVTSGPFKNYTVNLGPAAFEPRVGDGSGKDYNPRCLKRDVSPVFANGTRPTDVEKLIGGNDNLEAFTDTFEAKNGLHGNGHFTIGGDPGNDALVSAGDPIFYLHHGQVDRLWTIWQALDPEARFGSVFGTSTAFNEPPSANITSDFEMQFNVLSTL